VPFTLAQHIGTVRGLSAHSVNGTSTGQTDRWMGVTHNVGFSGRLHNNQSNL